jgi:glycosyltransferase involved in cell wall biosynthesis
MLGKPLIMVRGTVMCDVIEKEGIGVLIDCNIEGLRQGITELLNNKNEWNNKRTIMEKLYSEKYSWKIMEKRLLALYEQL